VPGAERDGRPRNRKWSQSVEVKVKEEGDSSAAGQRAASAVTRKRVGQEKVEVRRLRVETNRSTAIAEQCGAVQYSLESG
jgi:hypothetical protein